MVANSDIGAGVADPNVDLKDTFLSTFNVLVAMREAHIRKIAFASTSAVYGVHEETLEENIGPLFPISNYGAMKLASEALISAAVESYLERAWIFRFPNVIGPRATHGIIFDLLTKLSRQPADLEVLGDGTQQKPYLHVSELIEAMLWICEHAKDPLNISRALRFAPEELGATVVPSRMLQIDCNRWLLAMCVRVIADVVTLQRGNHIGTSARLEDARLLADHLEGRSDAEAGQHLRQPLRRIVILRQDVVLRVEPQRDVDRRGAALRERAHCERRNQQQTMKESIHGR